MYYENRGIDQREIRDLRKILTFRPRQPQSARAVAPFVTPFESEGYNRRFATSTSPPARRVVRASAPKSPSGSPQRAGRSERASGNASIVPDVVRQPVRRAGDRPGAERFLADSGPESGRNNRHKSPCPRRGSAGEAGCDRPGRERGGRAEDGFLSSASGELYMP